MALNDVRVSPGGPVFGSGSNNPNSVRANSRSEPSRQLHAFDDVDSDRFAHHHTLGEGPNQAASGAKVKLLEDRITALEVGDDPWHNVGSVGEPAFGAGWGSRGGWGPVAFKKIGPIVYLRGLANGPALAAGAVVSTIFTLPVGYRPDASGGHHFVVPSQTNAMTRILITNAGQVNTNFNGAASGAGFWWGLDVISFLGV